MQSGLYVALSGQMTLERRLETLANNVANATTTGFKGEDVKFESVISENTSAPTAFSSMGEPRLARRPGELVKTGNPLDVAIRGESFMAIATPSGTAYTRDGRLQITPTGELRTLTGHSVLDAGGAALLLNPSGGTPEISADGMITQGGRQVGALGLFRLEEAAKLRRFDTSAVLSDRPAIPTLDYGNDGFVQGFTERSNVNAVSEMSRLIYVQRAFDAVSASISIAETTMQGAIRNLGS